jgi:hypothetical protein
LILFPHLDDDVHGQCDAREQVAWDVGVAAHTRALSRGHLNAKRGGGARGGGLGGAGTVATVRHGKAHPGPALGARRRKVPREGGGRASHLTQPILDLWRLSEEVAPGRLVESVVWGGRLLETRLRGRGGKDGSLLGVAACLGPCGKGSGWGEI